MMSDTTEASAMALNFMISILEGESHLPGEAVQDARAFVKVLRDEVTKLEAAIQAAYFADADRMHRARVKELVGNVRDWIENDLIVDEDGALEMLCRLLLGEK
jgi:predicted Ser/Thr protein kinase